MGKLIAVVSGKGGTGKTTFTASVGLALAAMGRHVLCMDCDITLRNLDLALGLSDSALMDFSDVLSGSCSLADAVTTHPRYQKLDFLPAPLTFREPSYSAAQLLRLAASIRESYDFCLIDAPAGLGTGFRMATDMADSVIVVTTTDVSALRDAQHTVKLHDRVLRVAQHTVMELDRFPVGRVHLVVNRVQKKLLRSLHTTIDDAIDTAGLPLLGVVPEDIDVPASLNRGTPVREYSYYAARAFENIAKRINGIRTPLMKI